MDLANTVSTVTMGRISELSAFQWVTFEGREVVPRSGSEGRRELRAATKVTSSRWAALLTVQCAVS